MKEPFKITFMDDPDEAKVGPWASNRSGSGIYLEFIKWDLDEDPNRIIRISIANSYDLDELIVLMKEAQARSLLKTARP